MIELTDVLKREHKAAEIFHEEINNPEDRKVKGICHYTSLRRGEAEKNCNLKHQIPDQCPLYFTTDLVVMLIFYQETKKKIQQK